MQNGYGRSINSLDLFCFFQNVGNYRRNIYIEVIENKDDNGGDEDKGHQDEVISPANCIHMWRLTKVWFTLCRVNK